MKIEYLHPKFPTPSEVLGFICFKPASMPKRLWSACHSRSVGSSASISQSLTVDFATPTFAANSACERHFSARLTWILSPKLFTVVGKDFLGLRFVEMCVLDTLICRSVMPNRATLPWGEGEAQLRFGKFHGQVAVSAITTATKNCDKSKNPASLKRRGLKKANRINACCTGSVCGHRAGRIFCVPFHGNRG